MTIIPWNDRWQFVRTPFQSILLYIVEMYCESVGNKRSDDKSVSVKVIDELFSENKFFHGAEMWTCYIEKYIFMQFCVILG